MKFRGLLVAAALLVLLAGLVYWSNKREAAKEGEPDPDAPPKIVDIDADAINKIEIRASGQAPVTVEKGEDGQWTITEPGAYRADQSSVESLVSDVAQLDSNRLVDENVTDTAGYGFEEPSLTVIAHRADGEPVTLMVGDETPTGGNNFAWVEGDPRLFTLASWTKTSLEKTAWDLRDKRLLTFDSNKLSRIELATDGSTIEIGKDAAGDWQIVEPRPYRADGGSVEQLVSRLRDAKMDADLSGEEQAEAEQNFARASRVAVVEVTDESGTQEIEVRQTSDDEYLAKSSVVAGVHKVSSDVGEGLDKKLADLRNKKLFDFGFGQVDRIELRAGGETHLFEKSEDQWMKGGIRMDSVAVRALIDELRDLSAESFPEEGFDEPTIEITVVSENGERVEKVLISKSGDKFIGKRENEPALYELKAVDVDRVRAMAEDIREHQEEEPAEDREE